MTKFGETLPLFPDVPPDREPLGRADEPETRDPIRQALEAGRASTRLDTKLAPTAPVARVDTSQAAAEDILPVVAGLRRRVLLALVAAEPNGLIQEEVGTICGLKAQTATARLWELAGKHQKLRLPALVEMTAVKRLTGAGRKARVYRPTKLGLEVAAKMTREVP